MSDFERPWGRGRVVWTYDATANDNDKTILTVAANKIAKILEIYVQYTASADVGNRSPLLTVSDGANIIRTVGLGAALTATQVAVMTLSSNQAVVVTSRKQLGSTGGINAGWSDVIPNEYILPEGYIIRIYDAAAVTANDDIVFIAHYIEYDA